MKSIKKNTDLIKQELTRVKYSGKDFWTYFDDLKVLIKDKYGDLYNDWMASALGVMLLDVIAYVADNLSFYLDRQATDSYLVTAQTMNAVERCTRQLGYKMHGSVSGSTELNIKLKKAWAFEVKITKGIRFQGPNTLIFEVTDEVIFAPNEVGPKVVSIREGETRSQKFVSNGTKNQVFELTGKKENEFLAVDSVNVVVNEMAWKEKDFLDFGETYEENNHYEVAYGCDPPQLRFGDGIAGNIPIENTEIVVRYVVNNGKKGFAASNTITSLVAPLRINGNEIELEIEQPKPSVGASDGENYLHAKKVAPGYFKARDVAVVSKDFEYLSLGFSDPQFGIVAMAKPISVKNVIDDSYFLSRLSDIRELTAQYVPICTKNIPYLKRNIGKITTENEQVEENIEVISGITNDSIGNTEEVINNLRSAKNDQNEISENSIDISKEVRKGFTVIDDFELYLKDNPDRRLKDISSEWANSDRIKNVLNSIETENNEIKGYIASSKVKADRCVSFSEDTETNCNKTSETVNKIYTNTNKIKSETDLAREKLDAILNGLIDPMRQVNIACDGLYNHMDSMLSSECKINLIEVPILTKDQNGFYIAPSQALIKSLQEFLDVRKEPTITVKVTSGEQSLVLANLDIEIGANLGIVKSRVISDVENVVDNLLKNRDFGVSLYESQLDDVLSDILGVEWVNVRIESLKGEIDNDGNLIIDKNEVVSKGKLTINVIEITKE